MIVLNCIAYVIVHSGRHSYEKAAFCSNLLGNRIFRAASCGKALGNSIVLSGNHSLCKCSSTSITVEMM